MTDQTPIRPGYYGKVPSQGDFVSSGLGRDLTDNLDDWLRQNIRESQTQMGRKWLNAFLIAPVWKFALQPGVLCNETVIGVMMPSVDRVGRYFPLVICARLTEIEPNIATLNALKPWFDAAERAARSTLSPQFNIASLNAQMQELALFEPSEIPGADNVNWMTRWWNGADADSATSFDKMPEPQHYHLIFLTPAAPLDKPSAQPAPPPPEPTRLVLQTECYGASLQGTRSRALKEIATINPDRQIMSVISGLKDHPTMTHAIQSVAEQLKSAEEPFSMNDLVASAKGKLGTANTLLRARGIPTGETFAASVATLLVQAERYSVLWAGNARVYLLRDGTLNLLTRDHTEGRIPGILTRAVGAGPQLFVDSAIGQACEGDRFLLCSHGLVSALSERDIFDILSESTTVEKAANILTQDALIAGSQFDVTALVVQLTRKEGP